MLIPDSIYCLLFEDGSVYWGGSIVTPKWREAPDKEIEQLKIIFPTGDFLLLSGYEEYNIFVEAVAIIYGGSGVKPTYLFIMGKREGQVTSYRVVIGNHGKYEIGDVTIRQYPDGKEYDEKPTTGWHKGTK